MSEAGKPTDFVPTLYVDNLGGLVLGKEHSDGTTEYQDVAPTDLNDVAQLVRTSQTLHEIEHPAIEGADALEHIVGSGPDISRLRAVVGLPEFEDQPNDTIITDENGNILGWE